MALIKCSECGKVFSDKATACPNCACPTELIERETSEANELTKCCQNYEEIPGFETDENTVSNCWPNPPP